MFADRISQAIAHGAVGVARPGRLHGRCCGSAAPTWSATRSAPTPSAARSSRRSRRSRSNTNRAQAAGREFGPVTARGMRLCYAESSATSRRVGSSRAHERPRRRRTGQRPRHLRLRRPAARRARATSGSGYGGSSTGGSGMASLDSRHGAVSSRGGSFPRAAFAAWRAAGAGVADAELMSLIRRLTFVTSRPSALGTSVSDGFEVEPGARPASDTIAAQLGRATSAAAPAACAATGSQG